MVKKNNDIEKLFRKGLKDQEIPPSTRVWSGVKRQLFRKMFMQFSPGRFNILYAALLAATVITLALLYARPEQEHPKTMPENIRQEQPVLQAHETADSLAPDTLKVIPAPATEASGTQSEPSKPALDTGKTTPLKTRQVPATASSTASTPESGAISGGTSMATGEPPAVQAPEENDSTGTATLNLLPLAIFEPSVREGCAPLTVTFANLSQNSHAWQWSFGDGQETEQKEPAHRFENPGEYFVILTAEGDNHTVSTLTLTIVVHPRPEARFNMDAAGMPGNGKPVYFYNLSTGAESYEWHFGDGGVSHDREPVWNYDKAGRYTITLIARSASGCTDTLVMENAFDRGGPEIRFPNAFSPDMNGPTGGYYHAGDSNHDVFHPYTGEVPETYELKIYNRTGNLVFESHDFHLGWDGYYQGRLQPRGVYIWKTRGRFAGGKTFEEMGDVTMIYNVGP